MDEINANKVATEQPIPEVEITPPAPIQALVPTNREQVKAMVVASVKSALADQRESIGVSINWLAKHAEELHLKPDEVETLVLVKTEFGGLLPHAVKFLYQGLTAEEVRGCYQARQVLSSMEYSTSIKKIAKLAKTFSEADPDNEGLGETIAEAHRVISDRYRWVQYVDQSILILCAIAETYGCATIEGALCYVNSHRARSDGMLPSDRADEAERRRVAYEESRERY